MHDTRSGLSNSTLSNYFLLPAFRDLAMDPDYLAQAAPSHLIRAAQEMAQFRKLWPTFEVDKVKRAVLKEESKRKQKQKRRMDKQ